MTVAEFARAWRARQITPEHVTSECLANVRARNSELNAFTRVLANEALEQARQADRELQLRMAMGKDMDKRGLPPGDIPRAGGGAAPAPGMPGRGFGGGGGFSGGGGSFGGGGAGGSW